jgi:cell division protein ZapA
MKAIQEGATVSILGKQFSVACPDEERVALVAAAEYLDKKMRRIQDTGKVIGLERCAIMAALNISHELLDLRRNMGMPEDFENKLKSLQHKIDSALQEQTELEL